MKLYLIFFLLCINSIKSIAALPAFGSGSLDQVIMQEFNWHIDVNGSVIIDSVVINGSFLDRYPCSAAFKELGSSAGNFKNCQIFIEAGGQVQYSTLYTTVNALTATEALAFWTRKGVVLGKGSASSYAFIGIRVAGSNGSSETSYLPIGAMSGGGEGTGGVPPQETKPPLSCQISSGKISHGTINNDAVNGNRAVTNLVVSCNNNARVVFTAPGYTQSGVLLQGKGTLNARLSIGSTPLEKGYTLDVYNYTTLTVTSELMSQNPAALSGNYSASVVLIATYS